MLGDDTSPTDLLVLRQGHASGITYVDVTNLGGGGDLTIGDGIRIVETIEGATTDPAAFALGGPVVAGPYEYLLYRGDTVGDAPEDWYLRSSVSPPAPP